jgi:hypothetical protein
MAKYAFIMQDLNDEQLKGVTDVLRAALPEVGWTRHKIVEEDFLIDYNAHKLIVLTADTGNPTKETSDG